MPRVVPAFPKQGFVPVTVAAGLVCGIAMACADRGFGLLNIAPRWYPYIEFGSVFLPPLLWIAFITRLTSRKRTAVWSTWLFMFVLHMARICTGAFVDPADNGAHIFSPKIVGFLVASTSIAIVSSLIAWVAAWLLEKMHLLVIEQTGTLCWGCGYDMGTMDRCPECGSARRADSSQRRWFAVACVRGRRVLTLAILLALAIATPRFISRTIPTWRFRQAFPGGDVMAGLIPDTTNSAAPKTHVGPGVWVPFDDGSSVGVAFSCLIEEYDNVPAMQAMVYTRTVAGMNRSFTPVSPTISCDLTRTQAEWVVQNGITPEFMGAMRRNYQNRVLASQNIPAPTAESPEALIPSLDQN